jgi:hypothetical protein
MLHIEDKRLVLLRAIAWIIVLGMIQFSIADAPQTIRTDPLLVVAVALASAIHGYFGFNWVLTGKFSPTR